jgi:hypothetical protein
MNEPKSTGDGSVSGGKPCHICKLVKVVFLLTIGFLFGFIFGVLMSGGDGSGFAGK